MSGSFYRAFEDRYRGSRDLIKTRLQIYRPFLEGLAGAEPATALDLGCGRGEWLELLGEAGFAARGVDLDEGMLAACRERGLNVLNDDAINALRTTPDGSLSVVSAFHVVEHIAFDQVQILIGEALRALRPGGLLILETPNSENLTVGTSSFYDDPSHLRPLPSKLLAFAVEFSGFERHAVLRLQETQYVDGALRLFDVLAGVSPDYAIVAQKGGAPELRVALAREFARPYGTDLHTLAQRYQQQQDDVGAELGQLRAQEESRARALQQQLAEVDAQIAQVHSSVVGLGSRLAEADTTQAELVQLRVQEESRARALQQQLAEVDAQIARVHLSVVEFGSRLAESDVTQAALSVRMAEFEPSHAGVVQRLAYLEATQSSVAEHLARLEATHASLTGHLAHEESSRADLSGQLARTDVEHSALAARVVQLEAVQAKDSQRLGRLEMPARTQGDNESARLRQRMAATEQAQQTGVNEHARLAAHVAWLEGRLGHAEAQAADLRHHLLDLQRRQSGIGARMLRHVRPRLTQPGIQHHARRIISALARRLIQATLRQPTLKRGIRAIVMRIPGLHTRLIQMMYAQAPAGDITPVEADPLAADMSPRSLAVYRSLCALTKPKD